MFRFEGNSLLFLTFPCKVQAGTTAVGQEELLFLDLTETLWPTPGSNKAQLQGKHSWPFTFTVPAKVLVSEKQGTSSMHRLPPNFSERASPAYIDYRFLLTVKRGALRVNHTYVLLQTPQSLKPIYMNYQAFAILRLHAFNCRRVPLCIASTGL